MWRKEIGYGYRMKSRSLKVRMRNLRFTFFYIVMNVWILSLLCQIKDSEDLLSMSYPAEGITNTAFSKWKNTEGSRKAETAAVWKFCGNLTLFAEATGHRQTVCCYQMQGQPEAVFGKALTAGRYFTEEEKDVCLLDVETVRNLFGSEDVLGLEVKWSGKILKVAGILNENAPVCVIPAEKETVFEGIVLRRKDAGESSKQAVSLTEAALGRAESRILDGKLYFVTACILYGVMTAEAFILMGILTRRRAAGKRRKAWGLCFFCVGIGIAVLFIGIKAADFGSDYLPAYWSDFDFFGRLFEEKTGQIRQFLGHQEFACWQKMARVWRQAIGLEIVSGGLLAIVFVQAYSASP